ncbi:hypothetical protein QUF70_11695 [Desulfobacterales bacterium HSG17]|nr:hypothetical protein [Desulfobacterales bacterium HSG17]
MKNFDLIWPEKETCQQALETFSKFYLSHGIGIIDSIIGQIAVDSDLPIYTFNRKHYEVIPGIRIIEPYKRDNGK